MGCCYKREGYHHKNGKNDDTYAHRILILIIKEISEIHSLNDLELNRIAIEQMKVLENNWKYRWQKVADIINNYCEINNRFITRRKTFSLPRQKKGRCSELS